MVPALWVLENKSRIVVPSETVAMKLNESVSIEFFKLPRWNSGDIGK